MRRRRSGRLVAAVPAVVLAGPGHAGTAPPAGPCPPHLHVAIERASISVRSNPASLADGGLRDLIDEAVFQLVHQRLAEPGRDRERHARALRARLLAAQHPDGSWGPCVPSRENAERHAVLTSLAALEACCGEQP